MPCIRGHDIIQQGEVWRLEGEDAGEIRFRRVHHPQQIAAGLDGPIGIDGFWSS